MEHDTHEAPRRQQGLPFLEGEARRAERRNMIGLALARLCAAKRSQVTLALRELLMWVFNAFEERGEALVKTYSDLAAAPWGLCSDAETVRKHVVYRAKRLGLLVVEEQRYVSDGQRANAYSIDWEGISRILKGEVPGGRNAQPPGRNAQPPGRNAQPIKEITPHYNLTVNSVTGTGAAPPKPRMVLEENFAARDSGNGQRTSDQPDNGLSGDLVRGSPILRAAAERRIAPLPAGSLADGGAWAGLRTEHLCHRPRLVRWHRMQLSCARPVLGDTEADLLLAMATAAYAMSLRDAEVRRNRVAVFVSTISRRQWHRVMPFVSTAQRELETALHAHGARSIGYARADAGEALAAP